MIEIFGLEPEARWAYLKRFYREATEFYGASGTVGLVHWAAWLNVACERSEQTRHAPEGMRRRRRAQPSARGG